MYKKNALVSLMVLSMVVLVASTAYAGDKVKPGSITCEDFLVLEPVVQERVVYWIEGWGTEGDEIDELDEVDFYRPVAIIVTECKETPKKSVWQKIKSLF